MRTQLQKHQNDAVTAAIAALENLPRVTVVMPCGTGKTLVGAAVAARLAPNVCVILVPSLAIVRQTIQSWRECEALPGAEYIAVCSDQTVAEDDDIAPGEVGVEVTTEPEQLQRQLVRERRDSCVIVATYNSAAVVGAGLRAANLRADLAVYDEAHRTATGKASMFGASLQDEVLPAATRLFLTATPRVDPAMTQGAQTLSMDNVALYGPIAHALPMSEAIDKGLIVDYRILVSVVTSNELTGPPVSREEMHEHAAAIAIGKAMREFGLKKGFLFHRRVSEAASFASSAALCSESGATTMHVSGAMPTSERQRRMLAFSHADTALMANAKCLTEGVDVPSVDLVCFMSPKRSLIDVVQATGRALRVAPGKERGYVLLPLLVDVSAGETVAEALKRADMSEIANVLGELRRMEMPIARVRGRGHGVATREDIELALRFVQEKVLVSAASGVRDDVRESIRVMTLDDVRTPWEAKYSEVKDFIEANGYLRFGYGSVENERLGKFVSNCRTMKKNGTLSRRNIELLDEIGFPWTQEDAEWQMHFIRERVKWIGSGSPWEEEQRDALMNGKLSQERLQKLTEAGFNFVAGRQQAPEGLSDKQVPMQWKQRLEAVLKTRPPGRPGKGWSARKLAEVTGISKSSVQRHVKALESATVWGQMARPEEPEDRAPDPVQRERHGP